MHNCVPYINYTEYGGLTLLWLKEEDSLNLIVHLYDFIAQFVVAISADFYYINLLYSPSLTACNVVIVVINHFINNVIAEMSSTILVDANICTSSIKFTFINSNVFILTCAYL